MRPLLALLALLAALPAAAQSPAALAERALLSLPPAETAARPAAADTLFDQLDGLGSESGYYLSENFEEANDGVDSYLADEFAVPEDSIWTLERVGIGHFYEADEGFYTPAPSFNVVLWSDDEGRPGSEVYRADSLAAASTPPPAELTLGLLALDLPTPAELPAGTYWLTVQANLNFSANGTRFLWYSRLGEAGAPAHLFNYGGGLPTEVIGACNQAWGAVNGIECARDSRLAPSLTFVVLGTAAAAVVSAEDGGAPAAFALRAAYPNPVVGSATIAYDLPHAAPVTLEVFDALGRRLATLAEGTQAAGRHTARWDASSLPNGLYLYRLTAGAHTQTRKVVVAR